jgi:hypothetical protein
MALCLVLQNCNYPQSLIYFEKLNIMNAFQSVLRFKNNQLLNAYILGLRHAFGLEVEGVQLDTRFLEFQEKDGFHIFEAVQNNMDPNALVGLDLKLLEETYVMLKKKFKIDSD